MQIIPPKIRSADEVRVIAPSSSIKQPYITMQVRQAATSQLNSMGLKVSLGGHVEEIDEFGSSSVQHRLEDLHAAFADKNVKAILTAIGGFNSNELLKHIDYDLIKENPKILCGYSDITALQNAIYAKTGLVTYSGPHYFTFGVKHDLAYTESNFKKCLFEEKPFEVKPSGDITEWSGKKVAYLNYKNNGPWVMKKGEASGKIVGGNLCTLSLLQGTEFMPKLKNNILFIEEDGEFGANYFARNLQSLFQLPDSEKVQGLVIGRFQEDSGMTRNMLDKILKVIVKSDIPILANCDFGHTYPMTTFPIGGKASILASVDSKLTILKH
jgi:muramoyltetrapeptide carboxypeptidase